jgi:hypothetical protein
MLSFNVLGVTLLFCFCVKTNVSELFYCFILCLPLFNLNFFPFFFVHVSSGLYFLLKALPPPFPQFKLYISLLQAQQSKAPCIWKEEAKF